MKRKSICCFLFLFILCGGIAANAISVNDIKPTDRFFVNDYANVIDKRDEDAMYAAGAQLFEKTGAQIVAVTVDSIDGRDVQEYGLELGRSWGVGNKEDNTGIVLLLAMEERQVGINVGYGLEGAVTDAQSGVFLDTYALPRFEENNYSAGMRDVYTALINETYLEFGMEADPDYVPIKTVEDQNRRESSITLIGIVFVFLVFAFILPRVQRRYPHLIFIPIGGNYHHRHGGGSNGGFGGFSGGGGSFGGGGSSRGF